MIHRCQRLINNSLFQIRSPNQIMRGSLSSNSLLGGQLPYSLNTCKYNSYTFMSKYFFASGRDNKINKNNKNKEKEEIRRGQSKR